MELTEILDSVTSMVMMLLAAFLCFFTVRDKLRYSLTRVMATSAAASALIALICLFIPYQFEPFPYLIAGFFYYRHVARVPVPKLAFIMLMAANYLMMFSSLFVVWENLGLGLWQHFALDIAPAALFMPPLAWVMRKKLWPAMRDMSTEAFKALLPVALIFFVIIMFFSQQLSIVSFAYDWLRVAFTALLAITFSGVAMLMVTVLKSTAESARYQENLRIIEAQLASQSARYEEIAAHTREIKTLRHDMRHHLAALDGMLSEQHYEEAARYLNDYAGQMEPVELPLCECYVVDVIARRFKAQAEARGIRADFQLALPERSGIANSDLCIVLGNLMENAIHACDAQERGEKFLRVLARAEGPDVFISVDNSCNPEEASGGGLGISSVQTVAKKYGGFAKFERQGIEFHAAVLMYRDNIEASIPYPPSCSTRR